MTAFKPKEGVAYVAVRDLKVGQRFSLVQSPRQIKTVFRIDDPDRKTQVRVWYVNAKGEVRSTALFAGTKLLDRTGFKPRYTFIKRTNKGRINGLIPCYEFSEVNTDETRLIAINQFWR